MASALRSAICLRILNVWSLAERELFTRAIQQAGGNQARAARWLGISRITMKAKLVQFGLYQGRDPDAEA